LEGRRDAARGVLYRRMLRHTVVTTMLDTGIDPRVRRADGALL
jgi:hypothetical protein